MFKQKISIIVPVYNVEEFLPRCIESILNQTYVNWELLLIDDGSLDNSGKVCDKYAEIDGRIKVFHKENGGVSSARNVGLERNTGDWITFIDADDALDSKTLSFCSQYFSEVDMIRFSIRYLHSQDGKHYNDFIIDEISKELYLSQIVARDTVLGVCGGIYKKCLFEEHKLRFDTSLISGEDWLMLVLLVYYSSKVKLLNLPLYLYTVFNPNSCTYTYNYKTALSSIRAERSIEAILASKCGEQYYKASVKGRCRLVNDFVSHCIKHPELITKTEFYQFINEGGSISFQDIKYSDYSIIRRIRLLIYSTFWGKKIISIRLAKV